MSKANGEFAGKAVIVTGAASGLGRAAALAFAAQGAKLALADVNEGGLSDTVASAKSLAATAIAIPTDVSDAAACASLVARAVNEFGGLDALCNVAGICRFDHATSIAPETWDKIFAVNVRGPFLLIQAALPHLIAREGAVVNIASASAFFGHSYLTHYAASKAALVNLTKSLAMEFIKSPVRINAIAPGGLNTQMAGMGAPPEGIDMGLLGRYVPLRGVSEPEDLTDVILMLAGPRGRAFHGACINADKGITAG